MHRPLPLLALLAATPNARAFCNLAEIPGIGIDVSCSDAGHTWITGQLGDFLVPAIVDTMIEHDSDEDEGFADGDDKRHAQECRFAQWTDYMNTAYDQAVAALDPTDPQPYVAAGHFGRLLHGVQDFYAHSNWVELMEDRYGVGGYYNEGAILDRSTGYWPELAGGDRVHGGAIVIGALSSDPAKTPVDTLLPDYETIPLFTMPDGAVLPTLVSGWNPTLAGDTDPPQCYDLRPGQIIDQYSNDGAPRDRNLVHGNTWWDQLWDRDPHRTCEDDDPTFVCLNKDTPDRPYYAQAELLARLQTEQEWCRFLSLADTADFGNPTLRGQGATELLTLFGLDDAPYPRYSSTCSPAGDGPVDVKVTVTSVTVTHPYAPTATASTYALAVHDEDFHHIARSALTTTRTATPAPPAAIHLCVDEGSTVSVGLWGSEQVPDFPNDRIGYDANDVVIRGATNRLPPGFEGTLTATGDQLEFTYRIEVDPSDTDLDNDGLSDCGEAAAGSNPGLWDTDGDGLPDGYEVHVTGTSPALYDTDRDGLGDAEGGWVWGTDPLDYDSDDDGLGDGEEIWVYGTDPMRWDTDGDGHSDGAEVDCGLNPLSTHSHDDRAGDDSMIVCDVWMSDGDGDGRADSVEGDWGLDPKTFDSDLDGLSDGLDVTPASDRVTKLDGAVLSWDPKAADALRSDVVAALSLAEKYALDGQTDLAADQVRAARAILDGACADLDPYDKIDPSIDALLVCYELDRLDAALTGEPAPDPEGKDGK